MTSTLSWRHTGGGDEVSQEVELGNGEHSLLQVEGQPVGGEDGYSIRRFSQCCSLVLLHTPSSSKKEKNII
jgi:hypothetical protein